jgi:hypothetical protein
MRNLLFGAALALAALSGCAKSDDAKANPAAGKTEAKADDVKFPTMTVDEVEQAIASKSVTPVDCNGDRTRKKLGVVPGAIAVTDEDTYAASELPADKGAKLVFYCADPG